MLCQPAWGSNPTRWHHGGLLFLYDDLDANSNTTTSRSQRSTPGRHRLMKNLCLRPAEGVRTGKYPTATVAAGVGRVRRKLGKIPCGGHHRKDHILHLTAATGKQNADRNRTRLGNQGRFPTGRATPEAKNIGEHWGVADSACSPLSTPPEKTETTQKTQEEYKVGWRQGSLRQIGLTANIKPNVPVDLVWLLQRQQQQQPLQRST